MHSIPEPLKAEQCLLLKKFSDRLAPVLDEFNKAIEVARKMSGRFAKVLEQEDVQSALERLTAAREALTTPRFKVGFLGPFQCGKSTTLNNLLGVEIAGTGAGKATTSVITRLIVDPASTAPTLSLRYFTVDEYLQRRNVLCEWARLPNSAGRSESQLLDVLKTHNPSKGNLSAQRRVLDEDIPYLRAFLKSYEDNRSRNLVRATAYEEQASYKDKDKLLTHSDGEDGRTRPSPYLLLAESKVTFATHQVDPELELVDCPGLGSGRSVDDLLTKEYIPRLNGALLFLRAESMFSAEVLDILGDLKNTFRGKLESRVWVIVNKMDAPDRKAKLIGDTQGKTTFDLITDLERLHGIPLSQVCLGSNIIYALDGADKGRANREHALDKLHFKSTDELAIRDKLKPYPVLHTAFEEMLKDGSVALLRRLIKEKIGPSVAQEILTQAGEDAHKALADLNYALKQAEQPANAQELKDAMAWENAAYLLLSELSVLKVGQPPLPAGRGVLFLKLEELGRAARFHFEKEFDELVSDAVLGHMSIANLLDRFGTAANLMDREVDKVFDQVVRSAYAEVEGLIKKQNLARVALSEDRDAFGLWAAYHQEDRDGGTWREQLRPRLHDAAFLDRLGDPSLEQTFDGFKYKKLFLDKLRTASHQLTLAVRGRLRQRLDTLRREISRKLGAAARKSEIRNPKSE